MRTGVRYTTPSANFFANYHKKINKQNNMSQLKEILEKDKERGSLEQCAVVHLFREGTFYRDYEWSGWLLTV